MTRLCETANVLFEKSVVFLSYNKIAPSIAHSCLFNHEISISSKFSFVAQCEENFVSVPLSLLWNICVSPAICSF